MRVLILEDELPALEHLRRAVLAWNPSVEIASAESGAETRAWLSTHGTPDLILADIHLADGSSLPLLAELDVSCPVIFATAYDAYLQQALTLNAIDYLLKPIEPARVHAALEKYLRLREHFTGSLKKASGDVMGSRTSPRVRVVARKGADFVAVPVERVAWFTTEHRLTLLVDRDGARFLVDETLGALEEVLDPRRFFRVNRQHLLQVDAVKKFRSVGKGRLQLTLEPPADDDVVVPQEKAAQFRAWLEGV